MVTDSNTEQKILDAAEEVFHQKGYDGARMQEIAEEAGINKGLLHYYFKTKDKLFEAIFSMALNRMVSKISAILDLDISLDQKIDLIVEQYMALFTRNPNLPRFVLNELNKNPDEFIARHFNGDIKRAFAGFAVSVQREIEKGTIQPIDPRHLLMNMISLIIFPFIGRPMIQVVFGIDNTEFKKLISERREHIKRFLNAALRP
ncbi:MAG: TetR/AcrR family transcriptional regulator [Bacteroidetes bacterium]|jgi:AcrR family transcriptional regulator|nr:TetR/AcrR family transcriptional regulator [Bacteroidota bacterium]